MIDAQLTSPSEAVCAGTRIRFSCLQNGTHATWTVNLISPSMMLSGIVQGNLDGSILHFQGDPGFNFEIHIISSTSNRLTTELRVTAVRELNGVTVQCAGASGSFVSVIRVVPVGELRQRYDTWCACMYDLLIVIVKLKIPHLLQVES